jgi:anti-sigma regulatory factor (Ser/Thr protein kinase)
VGELRARVDVPADAFGPTMARRVVAATTVGWGVTSLRADAELVVSELVTNALMHAPGTESFELCVVRRPGGIRVELADGSSIAPVIRELEDGRPGGRGMRIVQTIAVAWGHDEEGQGKRVWVELGEPDRDGE